MLKKLKSKIIGILVLLMTMLMLPQITYAANTQTKKIGINETGSIEVENLTLSNITFKDYSNISSKSFGITGTITNTSAHDITYSTGVYYYDNDNKLIAKSVIKNKVPTGTNDYNQMSNLDILNGHKVNEIEYYQLVVSEKPYREPSKNSTVISRTQAYDYYIKDYDINIIVNENNTLDITENITAYFNVPKHGIFRTIPLKNQVKRLDGTTSKNKAQMTNVSVNNKYTTTKENGNYKIKIGDADKTLTGEQKYQIKYTYNLGKDPVNGYDELYYNVIGTEWDTVIQNVTFKITMPKEFDSSKLGFSVGSYGTTTNEDLEYIVNGNTIIGNYSKSLSVKEGITVRCELPEGYFTGAALAESPINKIISLVSIAFLGISIMLWYKYGRDDKVVETVEFYPPAGFNSLEIGYLYKGKVDNEDITSLLIYLANKGYIEIEEYEEQKLLFKKGTFKIRKLKEYDGNNENERIFLKGLFKKRATISLFNTSDDNETSGITEVTASDLQNNFYLTMNKIKLNMNNRANKNKIFKKSASSKTIFIVLMIIITYCIITIPPILDYTDPGMISFGLLFPGIGFTLMFSMLFGKVESSSSSIATKLFGIIWGLMFGGIPWVMAVLPSLLQDPIYLVNYVIGILSIMGMVICLKYLPNRTPYGIEMLGKIKGFKRYLETAEKARLEAMVMQDPNYFYNILPYTYVLGVSDKWIKKFETINIQSPTWYNSPNRFNMVTFGNFMNTTMTSARSSMSSSPSSSGSSGGGFSGGGSGGGGGGSW